MVYIHIVYFISLAVDCQWSEWSNSQCTATCNSPNTARASRTKTRTILTEPLHGGRECGNKTFEIEECDGLPVCQIRGK